MFESQYNIYRNRTSRPDNELPKELKNTFVVNFQTGEKKIDNRMRVRLTPHSVQFIYLSEMDERRGEFGVVVDSISITSPKETGRALLNFGKQNIVPEDLKLEKSESEKSVISCDFWEMPRKIYSNFPCFSGWEDACGEVPIGGVEKDDKDTSYFLKVCLLSFLEEFEMRESVFGISPLYDEVRGKLRQSKVYQLLCSKVKYDMLLYKDMESQCNEQVISDSEYNYVAKRFADLLMDKDLNKIIPPDYYDGEGWFDNPEEELNSVLKHTVKLKKHKTGEGEALKKKICDFFYAKHAIWYAQSTTAEKFFFVMAQISMAAFFIISGVSLLCFNVESFGTFANWYFSNFKWIALCISVAVAVLGLCCANTVKDDKLFYRLSLFYLFAFVILTGAYFIFYRGVDCYFKRYPLITGCLCGIPLACIIVCWIISKNSSVILPRILVSVAIMWLVTFVSEDLIKSQIGIFDRWVIIVFAIVLLVIVLVLLIGEIRQHSPYDAFKHLRKWWWKPILLLNSFVFVVGVSGMLMQFVFYKDLLKGSGALSEIVYADYFDELDNYQNQLEVLKTSLRDYQQMSGSYRLRPKNASGRNHGNISFQSTDTLGNPISNTQGSIDMSVDIQQESPDGIVELYNQSVDIVRESVAALKSTMEDSYESRVEMQSTAVNTLFASQFISQCESEITKDTTFANVLFYNLIYSHYEAEMEKDTDTVAVVEKWACDIIAQCDTTITIDTSDVKKILNDFVGNQRDLMSNRLVSFNAFFSNIGIIQDSIMNKIVDSSEADPVVAVNDGIATNIIMLIGQEQLRVEHNRLENNFDVLMDWSTYRENPKIDYSDFIRQSPYLAFIKNDAMNNHKVCREVGLKIDEKPMVLYPYLLLIHSLIVLILAFVGQLFISKETVSEPL